MDATRPQALISDLFDRWYGQPILVIGGGPSVGTDLPKLGITPACVISANDHGAHQKRFKVDLYVNCDKVHCFTRVPMEKILRPLGGAIVNRHSWADYRLPDWSFTGNSGLTAIAVACALGGNPVIVTGIDMWHNGRVYFHPTPDVPQHMRRLRHIVKPGASRRDKEAVKPLRAFAAGTNVRPMSGPLCNFFPAYDPDEVLPPQKPAAFRARCASQGNIRVNVVKPLRFGSFDATPIGRQLALSKSEFEKYMGCVERI